MTQSLPGRRVPIEDRIDQLSRLALIIILIMTLGALSLPKSQGEKPQEGVRKAGGAQQIARPCTVDLRNVLVTRSERRASTI